MEYQSLIGHEDPPHSFEIEKGHIRRFADAIGDPNPLYLDEEFARLQGYPSLIAPPTFPTAFRPVPAPAWYVALDKRKLLHGQQEYTYQRPLVAGDVITVNARIADVYTKAGSGGALTFIVQERTGTDASGNQVYTDRMVLIVRP